MSTEQKDEVLMFLGKLVAEIESVATEKVVSILSFCTKQLALEKRKLRGMLNDSDACK